MKASTLRTALVRCGIIVFFCVHVAGVASQSLLPYVEERIWRIVDPGHRNTVTNAIKHRTRTYMLATSQWQRWNLFSPDPLRRVVYFDLEYQTPEGWKHLEQWHYGDQNWWRKSYMLKIMRRLESRSHYKKIVKRYAHLRCAAHALPADTPVRIHKWFYVIPVNQGLTRPSWWKTRKKGWDKNLITETRCP